jgi:2-C-methyl-D-erythritol 4-phosphate cytidylyltransferase
MNPEKRPAVISAVVVAAGRGRRMESKVPKPYIQLHGLPILCHTLMRLQRHLPSLREIVVVVNREDREGVLERWQRHIAAAGATSFVDGGESRQESVKAGVEATAEAADLVLIHDAVRPFFPPEGLRQACRRALRADGAILAVPLADTLKRKGLEDLVGETVERKGLYLSQTPQVFRRERILAAIRRAAGVGGRATDDAQLVEEAGFQVALVAGSTRNIKITTPDDLVLARGLLAVEEGEESE